MTREQSHKSAGQASEQVAEPATNQVAPQVTHQVTPQVMKLVNSLTGEMTRAELMGVVGLKDRMNFSTNYLEAVINANLVEMTQPDSPNSPTQKHLLTELGRQFLQNIESE